MNRYTFKQPQSNYYENSEDSEDDIPEEVIKVPEEFLGPISFCLFKNPVKASDGFTYEQAEIEDWIDRCKKKNTKPFSPMTNQPLINTILVYDDEMRIKCDEFRQNRREFSKILIRKLSSRTSDLQKMVEQEQKEEKQELENLKKENNQPTQNKERTGQTEFQQTLEKQTTNNNNNYNPNNNNSQFKQKQLTEEEEIQLVLQLSLQKTTMSRNEEDEMFLKILELSKIDH
ncbi:wd repeat [Anaeramoeba flamelloides]|uniref:Wd repeat n=2 Tax=Anaeramoeba flamelloides TaxID=1746091 RepID=A0ABQ8XCD6_9EUKA|nr:wd repeat [Anaeramoeba flamelloides]